MDTKTQVVYLVYEYRQTAVSRGPPTFHFVLITHWRTIQVMVHYSNIDTKMLQRYRLAIV